MEVLHVYYGSCLRSCLYNEGLYAQMYSINLAAVRNRSDYAFGFNNLTNTHGDLESDYK